MKSIRLRFGAYFLRMSKQDDGFKVELHIRNVPTWRPNGEIYTADNVIFEQTYSTIERAGLVAVNFVPSVNAKLDWFVKYDEFMTYLEGKGE